MISLATLLQWKGTQPLGGVIGLSGYQILDEDKAGVNIEMVQKTPLLLYHGIGDTLMALSNALTSFEYLKNKVYAGDHAKNFQLQTEEGQDHTVSQPEKDLMKEWLLERFQEVEQRKPPVKKEGGPSDSFVDFDADDHGIRFFGNVHNNRGSYSETNSNPFEAPLDLSSYQGITLEARSKEDMNYRFGFQDRPGKDAITWEADFLVPASAPGCDAWNRIEIPFSEFVSQRGST